MSRWTSLVVLAALATSARADVWQRALEGGSGDAARDRYEAALHDGDDLATRANAKGLSLRAVTALIDQAIRAYQIAADARPHDGEPLFRIASLLQSFYTECEASFRGGQHPPPTCGIGALDVARARQALDAWDQFEARAPLDPRIAEALFSRAILRTKLVTTAANTRVHLEGARKDYLAVLDRADGMTMQSHNQVWGNLAETYMMLGQLDEAIEAYQVAIDKGGDASTVYGKAVALDRDERGAEALDLIRRLGARSFEDFRQRFQSGVVFFVPSGEEYYYFALIYEAFGYTSESLALWRQFLQSGAHPQYQARAKAHIDALSKRPAAPRPRQMDPFSGYP
jgi:tetratricopeptide (TPR) repeat protein